MSTIDQSNSWATFHLQPQEGPNQTLKILETAAQKKRVIDIQQWTKGGAIGAMATMVILEPTVGALTLIHHMIGYGTKQVDDGVRKLEEELAKK